MTQEPDLLISAGFSDAQLVKEANRIVAMYAKKGQEAQKAFQDAQGRVTNTTAARAHVRELDRLSKAYDPVYRAARQYEDEVKRLDRALQIGAITQTQHTAKVTAAATAMQAMTQTTGQAAAVVGTQLRSAAAGADTMRQSADNAGGGMRNLRFQVQNASYQVGDFAVQVGSGQSAMMALGQQLPQFLGGFGLVGALLGTVAAIAIPVGAALFRMGRGSEDAAERSKKFDDALSGVRSSMSDMADAIDLRVVGSTEDMIERFGRADDAVRQLMERLRDAAKADAFQGIGVSIEEAVNMLDSAESRAGEVFARFDQLRADQAAAQQLYARSRFEPDVPQWIQEAMGGQVEALRVEAERLNAEVANFGVTPDQIATFHDAWRALDQMLDDQNFSGAADQLVHIQEILRATGNSELVELADRLDQVTEELREGAKTAGEVAVRVEDISLAAQGISFDAAVAGAYSLADALTEAQRKMAGLETSQAQQMARARIRQEFVGNPVGEAEALARQDFRASLPEGADLTDQQRADYQAREDAYASEAAEIERLDQQRTAAERAAAEAEREAKKAAKKKKPNIFEEAERNLTGIEREIELLGKSSFETAKLRAEWAMLDAAKREGINVTDTMRAKIGEEAEEIARLTVELERGRISQQQYDQAVDGVSDALAGALFAGESLRNGLAQVFKSIASDILSSGIKNALTQQFSGASGGAAGFFGSLFGGGGGSGGGVGGFMKSLFSFDGGGDTPRGPRSGGVDGKGGFPAILHPNEKVVDFTRGQTSPTGGVTFAPQFNVGGAVTQADLDLLTGAVRKLRGDVPTIMANHDKRVR